MEKIKNKNIQNMNNLFTSPFAQSWLYFLIQNQISVYFVAVKVKK